MGDLAVAAVAHERRCEKRCRLACGKPRQEAHEPECKCLTPQRRPHARGFDERGGEEIVAGRLPSLAIPVVCVPATRFFAEQGAEIDVSGDARVIEREQERKCRVRMHARTHRIGGEREPGLKSSYKGFRERLQQIAPALALQGFVLRQFARKHERPCPAVRAFEAAGFGPRKIGDFRRDVRGGEPFVEQQPYFCTFGQVGKTPVKARQKPVTMDAGVPVETAEENRMERARALHIVRVRHDMVELVRPLAADMAKGRPREARRHVDGQSGHDPCALKRKTRTYIRKVLASKSRSAVGICARMTALRSRSRSAAGTMLKFAAIGVISVPQKPESMPIALMIAGLPPNLWTTSGNPMAAVITGNAAKALPMMIVNSAMPTQ